ncbi:hypothetical protein BGLA2_2110010 [Burkholderia gladioli]|nr:hypothetical protein BGLA2_2110010 [Burkholderia gladioli]
MRRCGQCKATPTGDHVHGVHANGQHRDDASCPMQTTASPQNKRERRTLPQARFIPQTTLPRMPSRIPGGTLASFVFRLLSPFRPADRGCPSCLRASRAPIGAGGERVCFLLRASARARPESRARMCFVMLWKASFHQRDSRSFRLTHSFLKFNSYKGLHLINFEFAGRYPLLMPRKGHPLFGG